MYPKAYIVYLVHFHADRDYFECHEILEEFWKEEERGSRQKHWVGLIQIAVSLYHQRRGNYAGAERMLGKAISILKEEALHVQNLGIDPDILLDRLYTRLVDIKQNQPYASLCLPITDPDLLDACDEECKKRGLIWGKESDLSNNFLLNKHTLRDRSEVINERKRQKNAKKQ
jgi:uncharacterized protein